MAPSLARTLRVAVVRLPRISNFTDIDALAVEPGVDVRFVTSAVEAADADLVVLPGSRATVRDLAWVRERGIDRVLSDRPVLGICGGYQMLAESIRNEVESDAGSVPGLGLLPMTVEFAAARRDRLDALGDLVAEHLDTDTVWRLLREGAPKGLPFVPPGAPPA